MAEYYDDSLKDVRFTKTQRKIFKLMYISKSKEEIAVELKLSMPELEKELEEMRKLFKSSPNGDYHR